MTRPLLLALVCCSLAGCATGPGAGTCELLVINRTPDKVKLTLVPLGVPDPQTSPMYQQTELAPRGNARLRVAKAEYSLLSEQDDWERPIKTRIDRRITTDATLELQRGELELTIKPSNVPIYQGELD